MASDRQRKSFELGIWGYAFGYFACYIPFAALTKAISKGWLEKLDGNGIQGLQIVPLSTAVSFLGMILFLTVMGWWKYAGKKTVAGISIPFPSIWTFLSGICTGGIIVTTVLAYTFSSSIVFMMLLMRGGLLIMSPIIDVITGRRVRWFSGAALVLSFGALVAAFVGKSSFSLQTIAVVDVILYLSCYFIRLQFMSRLAKSDDLSQRTRYFVEEQISATPTLLVILAVLAVINHGEQMMQLRAGFVHMFDTPVFWETVLLGALSQGTGIFGSLIFLDKRETAYCVPVNRSSSIIAGILAMVALWQIFPGKASAPTAHNLVGAAFIIGAIFFLTIPPLLEQRRVAARS